MQHIFQFRAAQIVTIVLTAGAMFTLLVPDSDVFCTYCLTQHLCCNCPDLPTYTKYIVDRAIFLVTCNFKAGMLICAGIVSRTQMFAMPGALSPKS